MLKVEKINKTNDYVYDISLDGTFVNALGGNVLSNTDGFNFRFPDVLTHTKENPYIGKGLNRNTQEGVEYYGVEGDVAEFNDLFMRGKMGLGIDEYAVSTINLSRKNYSDLLEGGKIKLVGNTIKSKKMPGYIEKFLNIGVKMLLYNKGKDFLNEYYNYVEKIYNYQIPLRDIASKGKIKRSIEDYKKDMKVLTTAGRPKSRQAWYELLIKENMRADIGETVYYINTGTSKSHSDVRKVTHKYIKDENNELVELTSSLERKIILEYGADRNEYDITNKKAASNYYKTFDKKLKKEIITKSIVKEEFEIILNASLLKNDIIESDNETLCGEELEYNVPKYLEQFNKRITPLLVCFSKNIRDNILISNPKDRNYYTTEQCKLTRGEPFKRKDQDSYEDLMTMEDKEIKFWISINETPPFINECNLNWEDIKSTYINKMEEIEKLGIKNVIEEYENIINTLTEDEIDEYMEEGKLPSRLLNIVVEDPLSNNLLSKEYNYIVIGNITDIIDRSENEIEDIQAEKKYNDFVDLEIDNE